MWYFDRMSCSYGIVPVRKYMIGFNVILSYPSLGTTDLSWILDHFSVGGDLWETQADEEEEEEEEEGKAEFPETKESICRSGSRSFVCYMSAAAFVQGFFSPRARWFIFYGRRGVRDLIQDRS
ncbi:hypothetical protein DPX16_3742 [Anabarilius grahami]|uniref:Uncharacterized protein n=1 Tax=Anabarilius grahami TaxID=495550 RepID=A0A3N0XUU8_ANAGA|nr:hypothetical protein DPX16_3742 [Anabarilius grahami]